MRGRGAAENPAGRFERLYYVEDLAEERAHIPHPIWGRRTRKIIESLWDEAWAQAPAAASSKAPR